MSTAPSARYARRQLLHTGEPLRLDPRRNSVARYLDLLSWKSPGDFLQDDPAAGYVVPREVREAPRTRRLIRELQSSVDALQPQGWNGPCAVRIALAQLLLRYERPDGALDLERGREDFGPAFDETLRAIRCGPMAEGIRESELRTGSPDAALMFELKDPERLQRLQDAYESASGETRAAAYFAARAAFAEEICLAFPEQTKTELAAFRSPPPSELWPAHIQRIESPAEPTPPARDDLARFWEDLQHWDVLPHFPALVTGQGPFRALPRLCAELRMSISQLGMVDDDVGLRLALAERVAAHTRRGVIDWQALEIDHPGITALLSTLSQRRLPAPAPPPDDFRVRLSAPRLAQRLRATLELTPAMPVVEGVLQRAGVSRPFAGSEVLARTHLLLSSAGMLEALGCEPHLTRLIAKDHSTHLPAADAQRARGFTVHSLAAAHGLPGASPESLEEVRQRWFLAGDEASAELRHFHGGELDSYRPMGSLVASFLQAHEAGRSIHVIDDGAELLLELARAGIDERITAVEQTRFGAWALREADLPFAVVNVADSPVKLLLESVLIGWSVVAETQRLVAELASSGIPPGTKVAVVGFGAVGTPVARLLRELGYEVSVLDTDETRFEAARADPSLQFEDWTHAVFTPGEPPSEEVLRLLGDADYVIGATGRRAVPDLSWLKDGATLISASSSTVEFAVDAPDVGFERVTQTQMRVPVAFQDRFVTLSGVSSRVAVVRLPEKDFLLANQGHPVNLNGHPDPIAARYIQLTRALLTLGSVQAKSLPSDVKGLVPLEAAGQLALAEEWMEQMRQEEGLPPLVRTMLEDGYRQLRSVLEAQLEAEGSAGGQRLRTPGER